MRLALQLINEKCSQWKAGRQVAIVNDEKQGGKAEVRQITQEACLME